MSRPLPRWEVSLSAAPDLAQIGRVVVLEEEALVKHRIDRFWELRVYKDGATVEYQGVEQLLAPGSAALFAPGSEVVHRMNPGACFCYAHFHFAPGEKSERIPIFSSFGVGGEEILHTAIAEAVGFYPQNPLRAGLRLWDVLWTLAGCEAAGPVAVARTEIEQRISEPVYVPDLARSAGISHTHLTRMFNSTFGASVVDYIRARRMEHAFHLLTSTTLPIKAIAAMVGLAEGTLFNKAVHKHFGLGPRAIRAGKKPKG